MCAQLSRSDSLPTGTLTFLFTDVEGSTRTLTDIGAEAYADTLEEHNRLIREAVAAHSGVEVDTQGDAFFCVFTSARDAVAAALDAQNRLAESPIRVRMGLHSGEALVVSGHYVGLDVHRAARVAGAAHGGQVLLSSTTAPLLEPGSFQLRDLGEHRLKDLSAPVRLFQLGDAAFPPLKTLHRTNLPLPSTPFLGRRREVDALKEQAQRLLTLTGPGGTGKTRLALQVAAERADDFPGGVFWVPLAPLRDEAVVPAAIASVFEAEDVATTAAAITEDTLLLVDNCEHVLDAAARVVSALLGANDKLRIITTSRERLAIGGEHVVAIDPLEPSDAVELFRMRAEAAGGIAGDDAVVTELCEQLDNLPLALELAAARTPALPPEVLLERLTQRLDLLRGPRDSDERQRTLRTTIAWSYDLLTPSEQRLLRNMSIFAGGATLSALEEVAEANIEDVESLVGKSLVRMTAGRYWMLETIREYAAEQLAGTDEDAGLGNRYVGAYSRLAEEHGALGSMDFPAASIEALQPELGNLRHAFQLSPDVALGAALGEIHGLHGRGAEGEAVLTATLELTDNPLMASKLHRRLASIYVRRNNLEAAANAYRAAEENLDGLPQDDRWWTEWLEVKLGQAQHHYWRGDDEALAQSVEALRAQVDERGNDEQRVHFFHIYFQHNMRRERYALSEETEQIARRLREIARAAGQWDADFSLGFALLWRGKPEEAGKYLQEALEGARRVGDVMIQTRCLVYGAVARRKLGDVDGVRALDSEIAELDETFSYSGLIAANRAWVAWRDGDAEETRRFATAAIDDWTRIGRAGPTVFQWTARFPLLAAAVREGDVDEAVKQAETMLDERQQPLPDELRMSLEAALRAPSLSAFEPALALARSAGYA